MRLATHSSRTARFHVGTASIALVFSMTPFLAVAPSGASSTPTSSPVTIHSGTPLTDTSLGANTVIEHMHMVNASLGYAIVGSSLQAAPYALAGATRRLDFALARTTDGGASWSLRAALPRTYFNEPYPPTWTSLNFVNARVGYLSNYHGSLFVTNNAGATWTRLRAPGIWPTYAIAGSRVFVSSEVCHQPLPSFGPLKCPSELSNFALGAATPSFSTSIPKLGPAGDFRAANVLAATAPHTVVVVEGGGEGTRSSLLLTLDAGQHWQLANNPCEGLTPEQILTGASSTFLLYCWMGGGMNQGTSELWQSNAATLNQWHLLSKANMTSSPKASIGDVANTLSYSSNRALLFGSLGGASNGLEVSRDGGRQWTDVDLPLANYGGAPSYVTTFGTTGAIFGITGGAQFRTLNATTWRPLPPLVAGPYHHLSICTARSGTTIRLHSTMTGNPASTLDYPIIFTNESARACYLNGFPTTQPVSGESRTPVGTQPFVSSNGNRGGFVILKAHGGSASVVFASEDANHYPKSDCVPEVMTGLTLHFAPPSTFYVATPRRSVCRDVATTFSGGVISGVVTWL